MKYDADALNLYRYVYDNPLFLTDPLGLTSGVTGPCEVKIWAGDTRDSHTSLKNFYNGNTGDNAYKGNASRICPSQYLGVLGCGNYAPGGPWSVDKLPGIPDDQQIPGFPVNPPLMPYEQMYGFLKDGLQAAREFVRQLCENRREFCDDGTPERYLCGANNQRCDSVTITVWLDETAIRVLGQTTEGKELLKELNRIVKDSEKTDCLAEQ